MMLKAAMLALLLSACATPPDDRYLTKEEDTALREKCEATGCVVVPTPLFEQIVRALKGVRGA